MRAAVFIVTILIAVASWLLLARPSAKPTAPNAPVVTPVPPAVPAPTVLPAEKPLPTHVVLAFRNDRLLDNGLAAMPFLSLLWQEGHADAKFTAVGQVDIDSGRAFPAEELVGDLDKDAGAVTGAGICAGGAAMPEVYQDLYPLIDDLVRAFAADTCDQTDAAGVMLLRGVI